MQDDLEKAAVPVRRSTWRELSVLAWPGILNMLSIIVQGIGLQYISASVSQMISGLPPCRMHGQVWSSATAECCGEAS